jgi:hypothetical protein
MKKLQISIWFAIVMITSFVMSRELITLSIITSIYALPLFIQEMRKEDEDV